MGDDRFIVIQEYSSNDIAKEVAKQKKEGYSLYQMTASAGSSLEWGKMTLWFKEAK